jgi:hypothetical protein
MRVDAFIICKAIRTQQELRDLEGVGTDTFIFDSFPAVFEIPAFVRVMGSHDTAEHELVIQVVDSQGNRRVEITNPVRFGPLNPSLPEGWDSHAMFSFGIELEVDAPEVFVVGASVGDWPAESQTIFVRQK